MKKQFSVDLNELSPEELMVVAKLLQKDKESNEKEDARVLIDSIDSDECIEQPMVSVVREHKKYSRGTKINYKELLAKCVQVIKSSNKPLKIARVICTARGNEINANSCLVKRLRKMLRKASGIVITKVGKYEVYHSKSVQAQTRVVKVVKQKKDRKRSMYNDFVSNTIKHYLSLGWNYDRAFLQARNDYRERKGQTALPSNNKVVVPNTDMFDALLMQFLEQALKSNGKVTQMSYELFMESINRKTPLFDTFLLNVFNDVDKIEEKLGLSKGSLVVVNSTLINKSWKGNS
jgi:hypothetical protein